MADICPNCAFASQVCSALFVVPLFSVGLFGALVAHLRPVTYSRILKLCEDYCSWKMVRLMEGARLFGEDFLNGG